MKLLRAQASEIVDSLDASNSKGYIPAVVQHAHTLQVIMSGFVEKSSYDVGLSSGPLTLYTRQQQSRGSGSDFGGLQDNDKRPFTIVEIFRDAYNDTLLILAIPKGINVPNSFGQEVSHGVGVLSMQRG